MGCSANASQAHSNAPLKKIVIVGGSYGGRYLLEEILAEIPGLPGFEITMVDKMGHFEFLPGNYSAFCDIKEFEKNSIAFDSVFSCYKEAHIKFVQGSLQKVLAEANQIELLSPEGNSFTLPYDSLVISTGQFKTGPWKPEETEAPPFQNRLQEWKAWNDKVLAAKSILCVGGGVTGIELSSEIKDRLPDKRVVLCQRGAVLAPEIAGANKKILPHLEKLGVEVLFNTEYSEGCDLASQFDLVLDCLPGRTLGPKLFLQGELAEAVEPYTGQIMVNDSLQVTNIHPITQKQPASPRIWGNIFSFGDCCITSRNEVKSIGSIAQMCPVLAKNIQSAAQGIFEKLDKIPEIHKGQVIPVGSKGGILFFNQMVLDLPSASQKKEEIRDTTMAMFRGDPKAMAAEKVKKKQMKRLFSAARSDWLWFMPFHVRKARKQNSEKKEALKARLA